MTQYATGESVIVNGAEAVDIALLDLTRIEVTRKRSAELFALFGAAQPIDDQFQSDRGRFTRNLRFLRCAHMGADNPRVGSEETDSLQLQSKA